MSNHKPSIIKQNWLKACEAHCKTAPRLNEKLNEQKYSSMEAAMRSLIVRWLNHQWSNALIKKQSKLNQPWTMQKRAAHCLTGLRSQIAEVGSANSV